jgi:hypothetical protein
MAQLIRPNPFDKQEVSMTVLETKRSRTGSIAGPHKASVIKGAAGYRAE